MTIMNASRALFAALCAYAALAGCAGGREENAASSLLPQTTLSGAPPRHHGRSWTDGGTVKDDLLYVTNSNAEVTVYRYWQHKLVGILTDFTKPMGECVDKNQDVYIADYAASKIVEYAHGGTKPIATFNDLPDSPYTCSVDPATGDLAVANDDGTSREGNIAIWRGTTGVRTTYTDSALNEFQDCAYDDHGNLLVTNGEGQYPYVSYFAWLPKDGANLLNIIVPGPQPSRTWHYVQGLQWDGKYFVIDDDESLYRESLIHGQFYYVGETDISDPEEYFNSGPIAFYNHTSGGQATQVVDGLIGDESGSIVDYWYYPAGGQPIATITHGLDKPFGVAVSLKK